MRKKNVTVYCGASFGVDERYQEVTRKLGEWIGKNNYNLVYGGGRSGLMGLIADSVLENGGKVTGIITHFLSEREIAHDGITKLIKVDTMSERKKKMADLADIFIALPGGPGTLEEITEVVSWAVLALHPCPCIFFNFDNYYNHIRDFYDLMVKKGYMKKEARDKILFTNSFEEIGNFIANYDTVVIKQNLAERLMPPNGKHWLGTDEFGRDIFARLIHGARVSLKVGILAISISVVVGGILGAISGYFGGLIDNIIMRVVDIFLAVPSILLAIAIVSALGPSMLNLMISISVSYVPNFARIVRASVLSIRDQEFIEAAKAIGASNTRIILKHIIPNSLAPVIVQGTLGVAGAILSTAGLSFIGLGIQPPAPEWGSMLSGGRQYLRYAWWVTTFPGVAIMITILSLNLLGDGLRDALDPRLKQ